MKPRIKRRSKAYRNWAAAIVLLFGLLSGASVHAQEDRVLVGFGWQSSWIASVRYGHVLDADFEPALEGIVEVPVTRGPHQGGRLLAGMRTWLPTDGWGAELSAHMGVGWSDDSASTLIGWVAQVGVSPGWHRGPSLVAVDVRWRGSLATCGWHKAPVDDLFSDRYLTETPGARQSARDGCFAAPSHHIVLGATGGTELGTAGYWRLSAGLDLAPRRVRLAVPVAPLPFMTLLEGGVRW